MSPAASGSGPRFESRVAQLLFAEGAFVRRDIDLSLEFTERFTTVTDIDIMAWYFDTMLVPRLVVGECKSGEGKSAPSAGDRLLWNAGIRQLVRADQAFVATAKAVTVDTRQLADRLGSFVLDPSDILRREELSGVPAGSQAGPHDPADSPTRAQVWSVAKKDDDLDRVFKFVTSQVWFESPVPGLKRCLGAAVLLGRRIGLPAPPDEVLVNGWLLQQVVVAASLMMTLLAGEARRQPEAVFAARLSQRLAEGLASRSQMEVISKEVDRFVTKALAREGVGAHRHAQWLGAFEPKPPAYTEPLIEVIERLARASDAAKDVSRLIDYRFSGAASDAETLPRLFPVKKETERLSRLVIRFLEGQCKLPPAAMALLEPKDASLGGRTQAPPDTDVQPSPVPGGTENGASAPAAETASLPGIDA